MIIDCDQAFRRSLQLNGANGATLHAWGEIHERSTVTLLSDKNFATEVAPSFLPQ